MNTNFSDLPEVEDAQIIETVGYDFGVTRRTFVQWLGAGLIIAAAAAPATALGQQSRSEQQSRRGGERRGGGGGGMRGRPVSIEARLHLGKDGSITVLTGKVEGGQGARAEISQAAAEELRVPVDRVRLVMADTALVPDDGITAGSRTTPGTLPAVRQACAAARALLAQAAAKRWNVPAEQVDVRDGAATLAAGDKKITYADLAGEESKNLLKQMPPADVTITPAKDWKALGKPTPRPNGREIVTGAHQYPCDVIRPGMLYAKVLRPPGYGATLRDVDLAPAKSMDGVVAVRDGDFVAVAAPTTYAAKRAVAALEPTAKWDVPPQISSARLYDHLREHADGLPPNPFAGEQQKPSGKLLSATYHVPYVQHAPMEPRSAVAEWVGDDRVTVWTSTQNPFGVRREVAAAFHIPDENVRVIVPDFGGGFGGKHTGECAVEAARIAKAAKKPVALRWTRPEEFTWAYFRPAAVIDVAAALDDAGTLAGWYFVNINSGPSGLETPYRVAKVEQKYVRSDPPLRHGSYRALAATANTFARESFMDELAHAAGKDPLKFRLAHLDEPRLRAVLEEAAKRFGWSDRAARKPGIGIGLACGTEKGSFVAACAEVAIDRTKGTLAVRKVSQVFECGAITNPANLMSQVQGGIIMALGPALREAIAFERGKVTNATFYEYEVPRFADVPPELDVHLLDRPDLPPSGAGETPLIAIAPAVNNAIFNATGVRLRELPLRLPPGTGASG